MSTRSLAATLGLAVEVTMGWPMRWVVVPLLMLLLVVARLAARSDQYR